MFLDPRFWLAMSFFIFSFLMIKYVMPIITRAIDGKRKQITNEINQAKSLKEQAEKLLADAKKYNTESLIYSQKLIGEAKDLASNLLSESQKSIEAEIRKKMELAKERIALEETIAIREIKSHIISSAIRIFEEKAQKISDDSSITINKKAISDISKIH